MMTAATGTSFIQPWALLGSPHAPTNVAEARMTDLRHRPAGALLRTTLPWLELQDHFIATVGCQSGRGRALGPLLVLADATFAPHSRFPLHGHEDMEILSIVLSGELTHHGDQAHGVTLGPRSAQLISARDGILHAEGNDSAEPTRMLQLWFKPDVLGGAPGYFRRDNARGPRALLAGDHEMPLRADAKVWWLDVAPGEALDISVGPRRLGYGVVVSGGLTSRAMRFGPGDGIELRAGDCRLGSSSPDLSSIVWVDVPAP